MSEATRGAKRKNIHPLPTQLSYGNVSRGVCDHDIRLYVKRYRLLQQYKGNTINITV